MKLWQPFFEKIVKIDEVFVKMASEVTSQNCIKKCNTIINCVTFFAYTLFIGGFPDYFIPFLKKIKKLYKLLLL